MMPEKTTHRTDISSPNSDLGAVTYSRSALLFAPWSMRVLLCAFALALVLGLFIQTILLPVLLPQLHAGHGLLRGGDAIGYHQDGVSLAKAIALKGWGEFELRPNLSALISISALVYYATGIHEPWILVPLNAAIFALGAAGLFNIFRHFVTSWVATFALFPYLFFPSSVQLYSQIYKDAWSVTGFVWLVYVWVLLASKRPISARSGMVLVIVAFLASSAIWLVRPYLAMIYLGVFASGALLIVGWDIVQGDAPRARRWLFLTAGIATIAFFALDLPARIAQTPAIKPSSNVLSVVRPYQPRSSCERESNALDSMLPSIVARGLKSIIAGRMNQIAPQVGGSSIDRDVCMRYPSDVIAYVPRAMQIALFAPFPSMWFTSGQSPGAYFMRSIAGLEMLVSYLIYPGIVLLLILDSGRRKQTILIMLVCSLLLFLFGTAVSNIGTLYRMRYGYIQVLLGLGIVGWTTFWLRIVNQCRLLYIARRRSEK
jgi:hypothetical protein